MRLLLSTLFMLGCGLADELEMGEWKEIRFTPKSGSAFGDIHEIEFVWEDVGKVGEPERQIVALSASIASGGFASILVAATGETRASCYRAVRNPAASCRKTTPDQIAQAAGK